MPILRTTLWLACAVFMTSWSIDAAAKQPLPQKLRTVGIDEQLGQTIPLDIELTNEKGERVKLAQYFGNDRPVIITLVYYNCPMLCTLILNGVTDALKEMDWTPGEEFDILTVSFDPTEVHELAAAKKQSYLKLYGRPEAGRGWHWFVGDAANIKRLTDALGFNYYYDEDRQEYAHTAALHLLSDSGKVSRYLYGLQFLPRDLRFGLMEAGEGKVGSTLEQLILFCYQYDPESESYAMVAMRVMQVGGAMTAILLGSSIGLMLWHEKRRRPTLTDAAREAEARSHDPAEATPTEQTDAPDGEARHS